MATKDVLLVGLGGVGTMCTSVKRFPDSQAQTISSDHTADSEALIAQLTDAYILQSSKLARVTVVARSNYDVVNGEHWVLMSHTARILG